MIVAFGCDLGFTSDSSALVGVARTDEDRYELISIDELRPTKGRPLRPKYVIDTFAERIKSFGARGFTADAHYKESAREHLAPHDLRFEDAPAGATGKEEVYLHAKKILHEARVRLPNHPRLLAQLRTVVGRPKPGGGTQITIPRRRGGGHGDVASAFVIGLYAATQAHQPVDPIEMQRFHAELETARRRGGPYFVGGPNGGVGSDGGAEYLSASYEGIGIK
jgi:hypothetical protein